MSEITEILNGLASNDPAASERFLVAVYDELRSLAKAKLIHENPGHSLEATALVHEVYLRLLPNLSSSSVDHESDTSESDHDPSDGGSINRWQNRAQFFAAASEAMRRILIDAARKRKARKRGGAVTKTDLDIERIAAACTDEELLAVHDVLDLLSATDPQAALLVKLRVFAGFQMAEIADVLAVSPRTAHNLWSYARAWLRERLGPDASSGK